MAKNARARIDKRRATEQEVKTMEENTAPVQSTGLTGEASPNEAPVQSTGLTGEASPNEDPVQSTGLTGEASPNEDPVQSTGLTGDLTIDWSKVDTSVVTPACLVYIGGEKTVHINPRGDNTEEEAAINTAVLNMWGGYVTRHITQSYGECYDGYCTCYPTAAKLLTSNVAAYMYNTILIERASHGEENEMYTLACASWVSYMQSHRDSDIDSCYKVWRDRNQEYSTIVTIDKAVKVYQDAIDVEKAAEEEKKLSSNLPTVFGKTNVNLIQLPSDMKFKSTELEASTRRIADCYNSVVSTLVEKNRMIAIELAKIEASGDYAKEGYKSLADYAATFFGFKKANTYMLSKAGKVYLDDSALPVVKALTPHKLAELNAVDLETVNKAFADGELTASSTSKDLRQFAERVARKNVETTPQEGVVTKVYTPYIKTATYLPGQTVNINFSVLLPREIQEWDEYITKEVFDETGQGRPTITKLPKLRVKSGDTTREFERRCYMTADIYMIVAFELSLPPKETTDADDKAKARQERIDNAPAALRPMLQGLSDAELDKLLGL